MICFILQYNTAEHCKQMKVWLKAADTETSLFKKCSWAVAHAEMAIEDLKKKQKFRECQKLKDLMTIANAYLTQVSDDDIAYMNEIDSKKKKTTPQVASTKSASTSTSSTQAQQQGTSTSTTSTSDGSDDSDVELVVSDDDDWDPDEEILIGEDELDEDEAYDFLEDTDVEALLNDLRQPLEDAGGTYHSSAYTISLVILDCDN